MRGALPSIGRGLLSDARREYGVTLILLLGLGIGGALVIRHATPFGPGLRDDSFAYLSSAKGLAEGIGYGRIAGDGSFRPLTGFPPLYSTSIAAVTLAGLTLEQAARLIGGGSYAAVIILAGLTVLVLTRSRLSCLITAGFALASPALIELHSWALSEGLFFDLLLATILCLTLYLDQGDDLYYALSIALAALTFLTRFAGASIVVTGGVLVALSLRNRPRRGLILGGLFVALASIPLLGFLLRNLLSTGNLANRAPASWHPPGEPELEVAGRTVLDWIGLGGQSSVRGAYENLVAVGVVVMLLYLVARFVAKTLKPADSVSREWWATGTIVGFNLALITLLLVSMSLFDRTILGAFPDVGWRLLAPLYLGFLLLFGVALGRGFSGRGAVQRVVLGAATASLLLVQSNLAIGKVETMRRDGLGFSSPPWRGSEAISILRGLPEVPIYTNDVPAVYLLGRRAASFTPIQSDPSTASQLLEYQGDLDRMHQTLCDRGGYLVLLGPAIRARLEKEYLADLNGEMSLEFEVPDGLFYRYTDQDCLRQ